MKTYILVLVAGGTLAAGGLAFADHDKACKNEHGKVTVVTQDGITVNDKLYKVGKTTRITKGDKVVKLEKVAAGDLVCLDPRGRDDIGGGEVAAITVLNLTDPVPTRERVYVREKETVRPSAHDRNCNHLHVKITRVQDSTLFVDGKPYVCSQTTRITRDGQTATIETIKGGDFVCLDRSDDTDPKVTSVVVLSPVEAEPFISREREIIREREKIREQK
jgi:hypothetical protein